MTTLNPTYTRRALGRLSTRSVPAAPRCASAPRYRWLRLSVPVPTPADSRGTRAVLSTSLSTDWIRVVETTGLVAVATGAVALLATLCR